MKKKKKNKYVRYVSSLKDIKNKTVIITGANSGIGFEIAKTALFKGARVVMACRNMDRASKAKEQLIELTGSSNIVIELYDQQDFKSINEFANVIKDKYSDFYALVLNAGIFLPKDAIDEFHISMVYRVNYIGAFKLLKCLEELIDNSSQERRIILQGSLATYFYKYKNKDKFIYDAARPFKQYCLSKLCVSNLYAYYRNRNENMYVKYLLCEPGIAATNLFSSFKTWFKKLSIAFIKTFANDSFKGSLSACKLMCDEAANGDYYHPRHFFSSRGLPKKDILSPKVINRSIIDDASAIMSIYERE